MADNMCVGALATPEQMLEMNERRWSDDTYDGYTMVTLFERRISIEDKLDKEMAEYARSIGIIPGVKVRVTSSNNGKDDIIYIVDVPDGGFGDADPIKVLGRACLTTIWNRLYYQRKHAEAELRIKELEEELAKLKGVER